MFLWWLWRWWTVTVELVMPDCWMWERTELTATTATHYPQRDRKRQSGEKHRRRRWTFFPPSCETWNKAFSKSDTTIIKPLYILYIICALLSLLRRRVFSFLLFFVHFHSFSHTFIQLTLPTVFPLQDDSDSHEWASSHHWRRHHHQLKEREGKQSLSLPLIPSIVLV